MGAQASRVSVCFAAHWADVWPTVGMTVHVALEVMLELKTTAAGGAAMEWAAAYKHSWIRGTSQLEGYWGWLGRTVQGLGCGSGGKLMTKHEFLFLSIWGNGRQTHQLRNCLHNQHGLGSDAAVLL